jgi:hypothetical protein
MAWRRGMLLLVTGGAGFIGRAVIAAADGIRIRCELGWRPRVGFLDGIAELVIGDGQLGHEVHQEVELTSGPCQRPAVQGGVRRGTSTVGPLEVSRLGSWAPLAACAAGLAPRRTAVGGPWDCVSPPAG